MSKFEKLGQILTDMANVATPSNGGERDNDFSGDHNVVAAYGELCYRAGRALSIYRQLKQEQD